MRPTAFKESNRVLGAGNNPNTVQLPIAISLDPSLPLPKPGEPGHCMIVSKWKMDEAEREEFERTGEIWVGVMALTTAPTQPPISLMTFNPFEHYGFDSLDLSDDFKIETD